MKKFLFLLGVVLTTINLTAKEKITSVLEVFDLESGQRKVVKEFPYRIEAPNWTVDGKWLIYNTSGKLFKISPDVESEIVQINTGFADSCNNDHVLSADGKGLAISHHTKEDRQSRIYTLSLDGGKPTLITPMFPSYLHGWSPDGEYLVYCGGRKGNYDIYKISATGGVEIRLTDSPFLDDGPEFSPDGKYIWFNSCRSGLMQLWRMNADGSNQTQMTFDEDRNSWFAHISPDGKSVVYLAYLKSEVEPSSHPANKNVELRLMSAEGGSSKVLTKFVGGQGTINVNSWSPDSKRFAFVSYKVEKDSE